MFVHGFCDIIYLFFVGSSFLITGAFDAMAGVVVGKCLCRGCAAPYCYGTEVAACGYDLGRQKFRKAAGRCHYCDLPSSPSSSSSCPQPHPSFTESTHPIACSLELFLPDAGEQFPLIATKNGVIPRTRHASGPCWDAHLGMIKDYVSDLQRRSAAHGWKLNYWSHEAMDATMQGVSDERLRRCFFAINVEYRAARADLFRFWLMLQRGGVWLDLRGNVSDDPGGFGLESLVRPFNIENGHLGPDFLLIYGGQHKQKFDNVYGEILNGFLMSAPGLSIWQAVIDRICGMIESYPQRWKDSAAVTQSHAVVDRSRQHYTADCEMAGREGVLCLGPLAMTAVIMPYLRQHRIDSLHLSKVVTQCIDFDSCHTLFKRGQWSKAQAVLFWKDPELAAQHRHYSSLCSPIVNLEFAAMPAPIFIPPPAEVPSSIPIAPGQAVAAVNPIPVFFPPPFEAPIPIPITPVQAASDVNSIPLSSTAEAAEVSRTPSSTQQQQPVVDSFSRSRSRGARCNVCDNADCKLSVCMECGEHGCKSCSFWCTFCSRKGCKYFICGRCHDNNTFLIEVQRRKVWACRWCHK